MLRLRATSSISGQIARREPTTSRDSAERFKRPGGERRDGENVSSRIRSRAQRSYANLGRSRWSARSKRVSSVGFRSTTRCAHAQPDVRALRQPSVERARRGIGRRRLVLFLPRLRGRFFLSSYRDPALPVRRNGSPNTVMANQSRGSRLKVSRTASFAAKQAVIASTPAFQRSIKAGSQR